MLSKIAIAVLAIEGCSFNNETFRVFVNFRWNFRAFIADKITWRMNVKLYNFKAYKLLVKLHYKVLTESYILLKYNAIKKKKKDSLL